MELIVEVKEVIYSFNFWKVRFRLLIWYRRRQGSKMRTMFTLGEKIFQQLIVLSTLRFSDHSLRIPMASSLCYLGYATMGLMAMRRHVRRNRNVIMVTKCKYKNRR